MRLSGDEVDDVDTARMQFSDALAGRDTGGRLERRDPLRKFDDSHRDLHYVQNAVLSF